MPARSTDIGDIRTPNVFAAMGDSARRASRIQWLGYGSAGLLRREATRNFGLLAPVRWRVAADPQAEVTG